MMASVCKANPCGDTRQLNRLAPTRKPDDKTKLMIRAKRTSLASLVVLLGHVIYAEAQPPELDINANDIAFNAQTGMLYASVPSAAGITYGNRLIEIAVPNASITRSVFVGSEPGPIGMSPDAAVAYVGLNGAAAVRPVDLTTMAAGTQFSLGNSQFNGANYAADIKVMPGSPNTIAISLRNNCCSPSFEGVIVYDGGVARPTVDQTVFGSTSIAFGSLPSILYGYDNEDTSFTLNRMSIDASGVTNVGSASGVISGFNVTIVTDGDTIFATNGAAVDGTNFGLLGTYSSNYANAVVVDNVSSSVILAQSNVLYVFDRDTYLPVNTIVIPAASGAPRAATGCGPACVAVAYNSNQIFIVQDVREIFANGFE